MKGAKVLAGAAALALLAAAGWWGWRWYTAPAPPDVPLAGVSPDTAELITRATKAVRERPRSARAWGELGLALFATGYREQAVTCLERAERLDPAEPRWPYWLGTTLLPSDPPRGLEHLRRALRVANDPAQREALAFALVLPLIEEGELDEAERHLGELSGARLDFARGLLAVGRNDREAARRSLGRVADDPRARKRACSLLAALVEDPAEAQRYRKRAAELPPDPGWPTAFSDDLAPYKGGLSRLATYEELKAQGRPDEALEFLRQVAAESPDESLSFTLGMELLGRGDPGGAEAAFRRALKANPRNAKAHLFLATALLRRAEAGEGGKELFKEALAAADGALAVQGDLAYAHLTRARALQHLDRPDEALAAFRAALLRGPEFAEMHQALGEALAERGQMGEALRHLEDAVRLARPGDVGPERALRKWREKAKKQE